MVKVNKSSDERFMEIRKLTPKLHKEAMSILNRVELTPEIRFDVINFPAPKLLGDTAAEIITWHLIRAITRWFHIPASEIISAAETGVESAALLHKISLAAKEDDPIASLKAKLAEVEAKRQVHVAAIKKIAADKDRLEREKWDHTNALIVLNGERRKLEEEIEKMENLKNEH